MLYGFKYSYLTQIIYTQLFSFQKLFAITAQSTYAEESTDGISTVG